MSRRACRWPGCSEQVPAHMWGCRRHWFTLPKSIRDRIWAAYRPGQEADRRISRDYVKADQLAQLWATDYEAEKAHAQWLFDAKGGGA